MRRTRIWVMLVAALVAGSLALAGVRGVAGQEAGEEVIAADQVPRPVAVSPVQRDGDGGVRQYPGATRACSEAELAFRVGGPLLEVLAQPGDEAASGDVLMRIDPRDYEDNIRVLEAQLSGAQASRNIAALDLERLTELLDQRVVSQADFDSRKASYDSAVAAVRSLEAQLAIARHKLEDTELAAPFAGVVTASYVENHEMVASGQVVLKMQDISRLEIDVSVPENEMPLFALSKGLEAAVTFSSLPGREFTARLEEWSSEASELTRTYTVTFVLDAPEDVRILPGMTADVHLSAGGETDPLTIPASAVVANGQGSPVVWVYDQATGTATRRRVETGALAADSRVTVLDGLQEGELVVVAGMDFIEEGMLLRPLAAE